MRVLLAVVLGWSLGVLLALAFLSGRANADGFDAGQFYEKKCTKCHGKYGEGDGRAVKTLNTVPKSFKDKSILEPDAKGRKWEERFFDAIKKGGPSIDQTKEMDAFELSDEEVKALIEFIKVNFMTSILYECKDTCPNPYT